MQKACERSVIVLTEDAAQFAPLIDAFGRMGYSISTRRGRPGPIEPGAVVCVGAGAADDLHADCASLAAESSPGAQAAGLLLLFDGEAPAALPVDEGLRRKVRALAYGLAPNCRVNAIAIEPGAAGLDQALGLLLESPAITGQTLKLSSAGGHEPRPSLESEAPPGQPRSPAPGVRRMFIRDLVLSAFIGVHRHEKAGRQRVRLNVDLAVLEGEVGPGDRLSDVVCYETMAARIRETAGAGHVNLVETLAERVAEICLADPRVLVARVRIEKLDIFRDAVSAGIEIERRQKLP